MLKKDEYVHIVNMEQQDGWRLWPSGRTVASFNPDGTCFNNASWPFAC